VGLRRAPAATRELDRLFWAVADPSQPGAVQVDGPAALASVVAADASTVAAATAWLRSIGADMASLRLHPAGDSIEVAWPAGAGKDKAPRADGAFSDFVVLKGARAAPASHRNPVRSRRTGSKGGVFNMTRGMHTEDSSLGPGPQSKAYGVPAGLKGTNKGNSQMVRASSEQRVSRGGGGLRRCAWCTAGARARRGQHVRSIFDCVMPTTAAPPPPGPRFCLQLFRGWALLPLLVLLPSK
jgi:hypothetical protein